MPQAASLPTLHVPNIGTTYHVSPSGNDTTGDGSLGNPWQTLQKARDHLRFTHVWAADVDIRIYVRAGTYQAAAATEMTLETTFDQVNRKPTATQWVIWEAYPGDARPVIKPPSGLTGAKIGVKCVTTGGFIGDFQQWRGLEFDGEQTVKGDGDVIGFYLSNSAANNELIDCWIHGMRANYVANGGAAARKAQGIYVDPAANNNRIYNCKVWDIGANLGTIDIQEHGIYVSGDTVKIWNCAVWDCPNGYGIQIYDGGAVMTAILIADCTIAGTFQKSCIVIHGNATNCVLKNNILKGATEYGIEFFPAPSGTGSGNIIDRNIDHGNTLGRSSHASPVGWTRSNETTADPLFVDYANRNFHIGAASPAIGYTDTNYAPAQDIEGTVRTAGAEDAGAYEYVTAGIAGQTHSTLKSHLDKLLGSANWTEGYAPTVASATINAQQLHELERVARASGYDLSIEGGVLRMTPR